MLFLMMEVDSLAVLIPFSSTMYPVLELRLTFSPAYTQGPLWAALIPMMLVSVVEVNVCKLKT